MAAYLNNDNIVRVAVDNGCDAIHPGYGFLSESAEFARACESKGIAFIGPQIETLELSGNKAAARALAVPAACLFCPERVKQPAVSKQRDFLVSFLKVAQ